MGKKPSRPRNKRVESCRAELAIATPDGRFIARYSDRGLCELEFPPGRTSRVALTRASGHVRQWHCLTIKALNLLLAGKKPAHLPPLDFSCGTPFQQAVWRVLAGIPSGRTLSYGEVARTIGQPRAVRAVGGACGANPIPVLVPCHRVLAAGGGLGGFSGGLHWKKKLLEREGALDAKPES